ncbi:Hydroxyacylglutathione hydrolase [Corynebacterium urogenitale]|uniref:Hydroxyacylglutathione hydrolase n=1 Tax=Corynebacterium urogenitale TaxID=2487892 RepID=A0A5J6Z728_9CORY|nr:MBL fold metallo-hydrolase [Corynebacterium urogenitale]QFQ01485.1 Hydroxyacylglutathione hydrolase [Corynebacterium urogenitale]
MNTPLSEAQYQSALAGETPALLRVYGHHGGYAGTTANPSKGRDELWVRALDMPGRGSMNFVYSTVHLGKDGVTVIDPGWPSRKDIQTSTFDPLDTFLRERGRSIEEVTTVIATHAHPDHIGAAGPLAELTGARLVVGVEENKSIEIARKGKDAANANEHYAVNPREVGAPEGVLEPMLEEVRQVRDHWYLPKQTPDILINDGDKLTDLGLSEDFPLEAVHTPGHTDGHLSFVDREQKILIAADHIMPIIFPGLGLSVGMLGGNPISQYMEAMHRLREFDGYTVIPGHGYCFTDLRTRRYETAEHVMKRAREVRAILSDDPQQSVWEIASKVTWSLGWEGMLKSRMLVSGIRQIIMYREIVERGELETWERNFE